MASVMGVRAADHTADWSSELLGVISQQGMSSATRQGKKLDSSERKLPDMLRVPCRAIHNPVCLH